MSPQRRARLAELALQYRFAIIEDDYDHEFHYAGKPVLPIASGCINAIYVGSLANLLAPGISTGFVAAAPAVFERLRSLRESLASRRLRRRSNTAGAAATKPVLMPGARRFASEPT